MSYQKFSERIGKRVAKVEIQLDYIDEDLLNGLWNVVYGYFVKPLGDNRYFQDSPFQDIIFELWLNHYKLPIDKIPSLSDNLRNKIRNDFFSWDYLDVYDFIDFLANRNSRYFNRDGFVSSCNKILKRELSGYRFVNNTLTPITNDLEIETIEKTINDSNGLGFEGVSLHLTNSLEKLSSRKNPDFRNSIKESISALESICQQITGDSKAELGKALKKLKQIIPIHGALEQGFLKIYGYTSDSNGIRHALLEEDDLDQEDALYMLVSCSAFINYLIAKWDKLYHQN